MSAEAPRIDKQTLLFDNTAFRQLRDEFDRWRSSRVKRERVPPRLLECAVAFAGTYGVPFVADALRLNTGRLRRHCLHNQQKMMLRANASTSTECQVATKKDTQHDEPQFVDMSLPEWPASMNEQHTKDAPHGCIVEIKRGDGDANASAAMRITFHNARPNLAELAQLFWGSR